MTVSLSRTHGLLLALGFVASVLALAPAPASAQETSDQSITEIAVGTDSLSTLVTLVTEAGLANTLAEPGDYTVFAPTNRAFEQLPSRMTDIIVSNPDILESVLLYHVVGEELFAEDVLSMSRIETLQGESLRPRAFGSRAFVDFSPISATDIDANNGVVHVIDRVLIPREARRDIIRAYFSGWRTH